MRWMAALLLAVAACPATANDGGDDDAAATAADAARAAFADMPRLERVPAIPGICGADTSVNQDAIYCTSDNRIYITHAAAAKPEAAHLVAHLAGHAAQVRHGVADVALATIIRNRDQETALRQDVTRMVECVAGVILSRTPLPPLSLVTLYDSEPLTGSHWGRNPLRIGPQVTLGLAERDLWFQKGLTAGHPDGCDTESFPADLLSEAYRD